MLSSLQILDPQTDAHFARISSIQIITEPHYHDFYEFFLVSRGEIFHIVNGHRELLKPGSLVLMRPHDRHHYEQHGDAPYELMNLAFSPSTLDALLAYLGQPNLAAELLAAPVPSRHLLNPADLAEVVRRMEELAEVAEGVTAESTTAKGQPQLAGQRDALRGRVRALLAELFVRFVLPRRPAATPAVPDWLTGLMRQMRQQEHFTAGLSRLYELAPVSPEHLARSMQRHLGQTPTDWLNSLKLHYAADLLAHTSEPVVSVALQAGFANLSHFYHLFTAQFGLPPARYRKVQSGRPLPAGRSGRVRPARPPRWKQA